jgi:protease I
MLAFYQTREEGMQTNMVLNAISKTVHTYFDGMHFGDTGRLRSVFHPEACLFGFYHGEFSRMPLEDWMTEVEGMDKPSETGEIFDMLIVATDVSGPTAQVKAAELYAGHRYTAYLSLVLVDSGWKIVNKLYLGH